MSGSSFIAAKDPRANYLAHKSEIDRAIRNVLENGRYILGEEVTLFEREFAGYVGVRFGLGVASGTDALHLALRVCGIGPGDAVITASHTAVATVAAIELAGAAAVLVDIDPETFTIDPNRLKETIEQYNDKPRAGEGHVKAVIPVHLYGQPADMPAIMDIAKSYGLYVIEDCAQSHGAAIHGRKTGAWGHISCFSFYPTKNLGAMGDGGAVATDNPELAKKARLLREYGWKDRYKSEIPGMNTRLDELQAAILRVKLRYLDGENDRRRDIARIYNSLLSEASAALTLPHEREGISHVYHQYVIRCAQREHLQRFLQEHSIDAPILYPVPVHLQPAYKERIIIGAGGLRQTERICREILSLPIYPELTDDNVRMVGESIIKWHRTKQRAG